MLKTNRKTTFSLTHLLIIIYIMFILFGFSMLFFPWISMKNISFGIGIFSILLGTILLIRYLVLNSSKNMEQYGFSIGVIFIILGICALFRAKDLANYFITIIGIILIASASIKLQYAVDLKVLSDKVWFLFLCLASFVGICAMLIFIFPFSKMEDQTLFTYLILTIDGIISLISMLYLSFRLKKDKMNDLLKNEPMQENQQDLHHDSATDESNFEYNKDINHGINK